MSVRGLARELSHAFGGTFNDPGTAKAGKATRQPAWPVTVVDQAGCDRFAARLVTGIDPPRRLHCGCSSRLVTAGIRTLGLAIDITNYVMLELGQPMHAFDADRIRGGLSRAAGDRWRATDHTGRCRAGYCPRRTWSSATTAGRCQPGRGHGRRDLRGDPRHHDQRPVRSRPLGPDHGRADRPAAQAVQRGGQAVGARGGPGAVPGRHRTRDRGSRSTTAARRPGRAGTDPRPELPGAAGHPQPRPGAAEPPDRGGVQPRTGSPSCWAVRLRRSSTDDGIAQRSPPSWRPDLLGPADLVEEVVRLDGFERVPSALPIAPPGHGLTPAQRRRR